VVAVFWVDGELSDDFAGCGVDDAGSFEGSSDADVVEVSIDAQGYCTGGDAVVADA